MKGDTEKLPWRCYSSGQNLSRLITRILVIGSAILTGIIIIDVITRLL